MEGQEMVRQDYKFFKKDFGLLLTEYRKSTGLTQAQLSQMVDMSQSTIGMYESGNRLPNILALAKIARVLWVRPDKLIPDITPPVVEDVDQMDIFDVIGEEDDEGTIG